MIIAYLLIGTAVGITAAVGAHLAGLSIWLVVLTYSLGGSAGTLLAALVIHGIVQLRPQIPDADAPAPALSR